MFTAFLLYAEVVNFYNLFWMTGEVHTSSQKSVEKISFFSSPPPPRPHHGLSAVSARSEWIRCGCSRAHKSSKHWGNVFQTCLPGVICQEWVTLLHTERAPSASVAHYSRQGLVFRVASLHQAALSRQDNGDNITTTQHAIVHYFVLSYHE